MDDSIENLFVIEAPGKVETLRAILDDLGIPGEVIATRGRLLDLPKDRIGLNPETLEPVEWVPINPHRVNDIIAASNRAETLYILTDSDREGEVIAYHVAKLTKHKNAIRLSVDGLSKDNIEQALRAGGEVDQNRVLAGVSRRALDRILGYVLSKPKNYKKSENTSVDHETAGSGRSNSGFIGRIQTPLLSVSMRSNPIVGYLRHYWPSEDSEHDWTLTIPVRRNQVDEAREIEQELQSFYPAPAGVLSSHEADCATAKPWDGGECLFWVSHQLDAPVQDVARSMQKSYETGRISYPRGDSRRVSTKAISRLNKISKSHGLPFDSLSAEKRSADDRNHIQDAHEAPGPISTEIPLHIDPASLSFDDKVIAAITTNLLQIGAPDSKIITEIANTVHGKLPDKLLDLLAKLGVKPVWIRQFKVDKGSIRREHYDPVFESRWHAKRKERNSSTVFKKIPNDRILLSMLLSNRLGRPSTYVSHIGKVSGRYMQEFLAPNKDAHLALRLSQQRAASLMNPEIVQKLEDVLDAPGADYNELPTVHSRVIKSLELLGIEIDFTRRTIRSIERSSDVPEPSVETIDPSFDL